MTFHAPSQKEKKEKEKEPSTCGVRDGPSHEGSSDASREGVVHLGKSTAQLGKDEPQKKVFYVPHTQNMFLSPHWAIHQLCWTAHITRRTILILRAKELNLLLNIARSNSCLLKFNFYRMLACWTKFGNILAFKLCVSNSKSLQHYNVSSLNWLHYYFVRKIYTLTHLIHLTCELLSDLNLCKEKIHTSPL